MKFLYILYAIQAFFTFCMISGPYNWKAARVGLDRMLVADPLIAIAEMVGMSLFSILGMLGFLYFLIKSRWTREDAKIGLLIGLGISVFTVFWPYIIGGFGGA